MQQTHAPAILIRLLNVSTNINKRNCLAIKTKATAAFWRKTEQQAVQICPTFSIVFFSLSLDVMQQACGNKLIWLNQLKSLCEEHLSILGSRLIVVDVVDDFLFEKGIAKHFMSGSQVLRNFDSSNPTQNTKNQIEAVFFNCKEHTQCSERIEHSRFMDISQLTKANKNMQYRTHTKSTDSYAWTGIEYVCTVYTLYICRLLWLMFGNLSLACECQLLPRRNISFQKH